MRFWIYVHSVVPFSFDLGTYGTGGLMSSQVHQDPRCEACWIRNLIFEEKVEKATIWL